MNSLSGRKSKELVDYLLRDYQFLDDYQIVDSEKANNYSFVARIKNTEQKVRFIKRKYSEEHLPRFKAMHKLYKNGIILADNMFILEECEELFFYVIEAEIQKGNQRFETLYHYLYSKEINQEEQKTMLGKIKILIDCLHQQGQAYAGLDPRKIVIDDEKHLYLAPFDLQFELKTDNYSRSYYSPEILQKINLSETQINEQMMQKWDIWSFGCICLQILSYASPVFMTSSLSEQLKQINKLNIEAQVTNFQSSIRNMVINSLNLNMSHRTISITTLNSISASVGDEAIESKQSISRICLAQKMPKGLSLRELNIHQRSEGDSFLELNLFTLSNIVFQKQLRVTVHADKPYHFFVDFSQKNPKKYKVNRKVSISANFQHFQKWMNQTLVIELKEEEKEGKININLRSLILLQNNSRIWTDPLIGSYSSPTDCDFPKARLKISCKLTTPDSLSSENDMANKGEIEKTKNDSNGKAKDRSLKVKESSHKKQANYEVLGEKIQNISVQRKPFSSVLAKNLAKIRQDQNIPSISQISKSIGLMAEELKRKMQGEAPSASDEIQKQLSVLLDIE